MANELQPLSLLFQNRLFLIPDYQRGYAWLQQQLVDFWDDLVNLQADRYHYTGLLSLKPLKCKETVSWCEDLCRRDRLKIHLPKKTAEWSSNNIPFWL